jgi:hypothetical protein
VAAAASAVATRCGSNDFPAAVRRSRMHRSTQPSTARSVLAISSAEYSSTSRPPVQIPELAKPQELDPEREE